MARSQHPQVNKKRSKQRSTGADPSTAKSGTDKEKKNALGLWKIIVGALVALVLSAGFISAAIPKYKIRITAPALKKDNVYQAHTGSVTIRWMISKEQWFREVDVAGVKANVTLKKSGEDDKHFRESAGEVTLNLLQAGTYEVGVDAFEQGRSETIALEVSASTSVGADDRSSYFRGSVEDKNGKPVDGAEVELTEILGQPVLKTTTTNDGGFNISPIPARIGDRVRVIVRVNGVEKYNQYWTLPGPADIKLEK
ncbi:MAG TPA: carboxypeptidase-like regulatory domain-containing protein [Blastocatellia bacterium]|nr:carboxypeptidase-like regulatory domain-containing protein [Blastocatellia bacterium]